MKFCKKYILIGLIILFTGGFYGLNAGLSSFGSEFPAITLARESSAIAPEDSLKPLFPVEKIVPENYKELIQSHPIDLRAPETFNSGFQYNPFNNRYELRSKIGDSDITTPISLTPEEYYKYSLQRSMDAYYREKYAEEFLSADSAKKKDILSIFDFNFDLGPAEKIFGPGGVKVNAQGNIITKMGFTHTSTGNPTLTEKQRSRTAFDFDAQIQSNFAASVGDKINFDLNYNTESTMSFDTKKIKLAYQGKEDEVLKVLEAGNVSMNTTNSLIRGGNALFGIKTEMQFGKLTVGAIFSQQESQSRSVSSKGNVQTTPFEVTVDMYDENMHYFLSHYFYDHYDDAMVSLPYIRSGINIDRIEVWITNRRSDYTEARNIVAFTDLAENQHISSPGFIHPSGSEPVPYNKANDLYTNLINNYPDARNISQVNQVLGSTPLDGGQDYEKVENARKLGSSEYSFDPQLGYISLRNPLQPDEVLAVAYSYTYNGTTYQTGEFSTDNPNSTTDNLYVKLIKGTMGSPASATWKLMMKNVYTITHNYIDQDKFRLNIKYQNDTTGVFLNYITEGNIANQLLLRVMNLDNMDARKNPYSDGYFDFIEGKTIYAQLGKIVFPVIEPFGSHLRKKIGNDAIADKYVFQELYDSTLTVARQIAEKNKFILQGEYKGSGDASIGLNGSNIAKGSVVVMANGVRLKENVDYIVDYAGGGVTVINPLYKDTDLQISSEDQSSFGIGMQRKTIMGLNLNYAFNPKFNIGATIMNLSEMPTTMKTLPGQESVNNTLFGFNTNYATQSQALTNLLDKLPFLELTAPSQITFNAEYARLIPGHYHSKYGGDYSYIDDFEQAKTPIDLRSPYSWNLASTPSMFAESRLVNNIDYGKNRSLLAWYYIDGLFTRKSSLTPNHIKNDFDQLSNHYVREISEAELFPNKDQRYNESAMLPVLNLAYYPFDRGPYNMDVNGMGTDGKLLNPEKRWAGITRRIESGYTDFEANNFETVEFWLLDPFINSPNAKGGDLYLNLGEISEDILKDEKKFFENGLPVNGDTTKVEKTVWGLVPRQQSLVYAFDNTEGARKYQDVGLDGLINEAEFSYPTYRDYIEALQNRLSPEALQAMRDDPFSPLNDPAGDNYHYFRGSDYDQKEVPILGRYKRYNGTEGNSADTNDSPENYNTAAKLVPDVEDINQDNTLNEIEKYFQYKVSIRPENMKVGENFITQKIDVKPNPVLKNGNDETISWYQFKIPIQEFEGKIGDIRDFKTIRFMRMFLTNFSDSVILRFGALELVYGSWRTYTQDLSNPNLPPTGNASISLSTVNIEESGSKEPVNYVIPPGVNRILDPSQPQLRQQNEQALSVQITGLQPGDARAIYKSTGLDTRQYRRIQMFSHAEKLAEDINGLQDNDLSIFIRLGSDYKNNYYEYEVPVKITPPGRYDESTASREIVWPKSNMFDFPFELLTNLKLARNTEKRKAGSTVTYYTPFSSYDPNSPMNKVTIIGNPSISDIKVIMIGLRNNSRNTQSVEMWVNELRLTEFNEDGGWAGNANLYLGLSDMGSFNFSGSRETAGFGSLDQGIMERNLDDTYQFNVGTQLELGRFFPEKAKVSIPFYYSYQEKVISPKYNPLDQDILLKDALNAVATKAEKDSIRSFAQDKATTRSVNFNNVRVDIRSEKPMPYDPANFTFAYSVMENNIQNATTQYEKTTNTRLSLNYNYSPMIKPWQPFKSSGNAESKNEGSAASASSAGLKNKFLQEITVQYLPNSISLNSDISRDYYEFQLRDLGNLGENMIPPSFREDFLWNRSTAIQWNLTKNLSMSFNSGTNARIEAPHVLVNKKFNPDEYTLWKDSVLLSIRSLGTPMEYKQTFMATYNFPFQQIPILNFINGSLKFDSGYEWRKGAMLAAEDINFGNEISNNRTIGIENVRVNLLSLYNKFEFLKKANDKYTPKRTSTARRNNQRGAEENQKKEAAEKRKKKFEGEITLNTDSGTIINHRLDNKHLRITARKTDGKLYDIKYKTIDNNTIRIKNTDSVSLKLSISQLPPLEESKWYQVAQGATRVLMMVREFSFSYSESSRMMIPNFNPQVGDFFGQGATPLGNAPGLDFAFGLTGEEYLEKAQRNDWLIKNKENITPSMFNKTQTFNFQSQLEPIPGMRISLNATRSKTESNQVYFMYDNAPNKVTGDFRMTTISLKSAFESVNATNGYFSQNFDNFLENRYIIADRLDQVYKKAVYPNSGFLVGSNLAGQPYDPSIGAVDLNATDVLIPAFIAAYTGKNPHSVDISAFPSLLDLLPNWKLAYDGLMQHPLISKHFRNFTIEHQYSSVYTVGAYNSYLNWIAISNSDEFGFIQSILTDNPYPSSPYDITAVGITEGFNPLIGINSTFLNNINLTFKYNISRNVNLNISSYQISEIFKKDFTFGTGYRFENFNKVLKIKKTGGANFNNELKVKIDVNFAKTQSLIRKIQENFTQAIEGNSQTTIKFSADYNLSRLITLQAFFDKQISKPLVSSTAYPVSKSSFGISINVSLAR
ncbi:MAG: cell surface protein SprA [Candidatus Symbiothrix sp.]|jgi:cell surface protein SprA|nr:cell surface protein SprA [Candidatus Symbiothrix sp.]